MEIILKFIYCLMWISHYSSCSYLWHKSKLLFYQQQLLNGKGWFISYGYLFSLALLDDTYNISFWMDWNLRVIFAFMPKQVNPILILWEPPFLRGLDFVITLREEIKVDFIEPITIWGKDIFLTYQKWRNLEGVQRTLKERSQHI